VGANGFVGRHLLEHARGLGHPVLGVVRSAAAAALVETLGGEPLELPDLGQDATAGLSAPLRGCAGVVYTASVSAAPGATDRTDPQGLLNVIAAARSAGVARLAFFSGLGVARYGMNPFSTNPYFLAKMAGETALFRSGLGVTVFRPSYIFGWGDEFLTPLIERLTETGAVEVPGDGSYRLQPISVRDAARAALRALSAENPPVEVVDLVGPEVVTYRALISRLAAEIGRTIEVTSRDLDEALAQARASNYFGLRAHELACLLCDEVSVASRAVELAGGSLESLDEMIASTVRAVVAEKGRP